MPAWPGSPASTSVSALALADDGPLDLVEHLAGEPGGLRYVDGGRSVRSQLLDPSQYGVDLAQAHPARRPGLDEVHHLGAEQLDGAGAVGCPSWTPCRSASRRSASSRSWRASALVGSPRGEVDRSRRVPVGRTSRPSRDATAETSGVCERHAGDVAGRRDPPSRGRPARSPPATRASHHRAAVTGATARRSWCSTVSAARARSRSSSVSSWEENRASAVERCRDRGRRPRRPGARPAPAR